jgi:hypothetical protein
MQTLVRRSSVVLAGALLFVSGWLLGNENAVTQQTTIHAAAWTAADSMTQQDFDNFKKLSAGLVGQVPGLRRIWVGKLAKPITAEGIQRNYGVVLEFDDAKSKEAYSSNRPPEWYATLNKLRNPQGSTSFDVVGE